MGSHVDPVRRYEKRAMKGYYSKLIQSFLGTRNHMSICQSQYQRRMDLLSTFDILMMGLLRQPCQSPALYVFPWTFTTKLEAERLFLFLSPSSNLIPGVKARSAVVVSVCSYQ